MRLFAAVGGFVLLANVNVSASEQTTYNYDAKGRLVKVVHARPADAAFVADYQYDKAGNRVHVVISGAHNTAPPTTLARPI